MTPLDFGDPPFSVVRLDEISPVGWKNGGGQTRELLAWPDAEDWRLRLSVAEIRRDGPFSPFPGVVRWFAVIEGKGVVLALGTEEKTLRAGSAPLCFDGAAAPDCRLIDGPTRDLNLMHSGGRGTMAIARPGEAWAGDFAQRGLWSAVAGRLVGERGRPVSIAPNTLLWQPDAKPGAWRFEPDAAAPAEPAAWWLGYTPEESRVFS